MKSVIGVDTSCYTTSIAAVSLEGDLLASDRKLLRVASGRRGLMQSEAVFQHVLSLPDRVAAVMDAAGDLQICAVAASTRPRPEEESYMPVFRAGESQARTVASLLRVPFYPFSHQEGHVRAALVGTGIRMQDKFLAFHLSGGTTEALVVEQGKIRLFGGTRDLHAGQLVDRVGVRLGLGFPCGPELEKLAVQAEAKGLLPVAIRGRDCSISGAETRLMQLLSQGLLTPEEASAEVYDFLARTIARMMETAIHETGLHQVLLAGGVASSTLFRTLVQERNRKMRLGAELSFARPELSGDNAVGIALLGAEAFKKGDKQ